MDALYHRTSMIWKLGCKLDRMSTFLLFSIIFLLHEAVAFDPFSVAARCPFSCTVDRSAWAQYSSLRSLESCNTTTLIDFNLYYDTGDGSLPLPVRSCAIRSGSNTHSSDNQDPVVGFDVSETIEETILALQIGGEPQPSTVPVSNMQAAVQGLAAHIQLERNGQKAILFAKHDSFVLGIYAGIQIEKRTIVGVIESFAGALAQHSEPWRSASAQICFAEESRSVAQTIGIYADSTGDMDATQRAVRAWNDAECLDNSSWDEAIAMRNLSIRTVTPRESPDNHEILVDRVSYGDHHGLNKRQGGTCDYTQTEPGDGCWALADRCGISQSELVEYNEPDLCNNLIVGEYVCCSPGGLPDFTPQPNPDGSCRTHEVVSGDICDTIARENEMTVDDIEERNRMTWGWMGCSHLMVGGRICLSTGRPPMPSPVENAVCGPQVPGTEEPDDMDDLVDLNPCPLNVCCNVWGQCGITEDFCIPAPADTGAPGAALPGSNGCISSCGMDIINNESPPSTFRRVGYFEAWNLERDCLHMMVSL